MDKKDILIGIIIGLISAGIGLILAVILFGNSNDWIGVIKNAIERGLFTKLMSIGALLNLGVFFFFLRKKQDEKAKGVLIATLLILFITIILKFTN